jgi:3-oxoacyl-[acyl-carrier-protein] synthase-1
MISALGNLPTSCAAARAGLSRCLPLDHLTLDNPTTGEPEAAVGHQAHSSLTHGFAGFGRLVRLAQAALEDLSARRDLRRLPPKAAAYLSLPPADRTQGGAKLISDEAVRERYLDPDLNAAVRHRPPSELWSRAASLAGVFAAPPPLAYSSVLGHAGVADALYRASMDLTAGAVDAAIVGGADSLVDERVLGWLSATGRLKCAGAPAGLIPGEAAAFLLLERAVDVAPREDKPLAALLPSSTVLDAPSQLEGNVPLGTEIARLLAAQEPLAQWSNGQRAWLVADTNGEDFRALELGHALVRLRARFEAFAAPVVWYPAVSFGDTAAASGALAICVALAAFSRGYAPGAVASVTSASDGPARASTLVVGLKSSEGRFS